MGVGFGKDLWPAYTEWGFLGRENGNGGPGGGMNRLGRLFQQGVIGSANLRKGLFSVGTYFF